VRGLVSINRRRPGGRAGAAASGRPGSGGELQRWPEFNASGIPPFAEPFFRELNANVELAPAMNGDDLQKGLSQLG
jgi:hypothetical protein